MSTTISGVEVELGRLSDDWRKFGVTVKVWSKTRPGLKATNEIDPGLMTNVQSVLQIIGAAGGACAEYLGKKYKDNIDPTTAANLAMRAFSEECRLSKELSLSAPAKLIRILGQEHLLNNQEQEFYQRCQWMIDHGQALTAREVLAIDSLIARLHARQV